MNNFKSFTTFEEGINELRKLVPNIKEYTKEATTEQEVVSDLMYKINENYPSVSNPEYPATYSLSVNAHEVGFKTRSFFGFGWRVIVEDGEAATSYGFRISFSEHNRFAVTKIEGILAENGWRSVPVSRKTSHKSDKAKTIKK
jgi:hypothetical protein